MRAHLRTRTGALTALLALGLGTFSVAVLPSAQAADPLTLNLLNINDFHGRIDANTTKFATTIEKLRAAGGESNTLFLSAGDNIGASLFASSQAKDQPTIDVLNALGLQASAVGNHEFDQGFGDLTGRVADAADWSYLGANVYQKGTTTPALPEYATFQAAGVTVGVIGAVTQETPSLVSPAGVANLDFGDPVAAVNRVADQLSDGNTANGEADVLVAEYHEGASAGTPDGATLDQEVAAGGAFADIVTKTSAKVDAIFTGHTHKQYAWDAPVPGSTIGATRPIVQTGSYGENIGQITLTLDPVTHTVLAHTAANIARSTTEDLSYARVAAVKKITDAALAQAAEVGNQPVGSITSSITTAYTDGTYGADGYTGGTRDDRSSESALGDLVANALRDGIPASQGTADLGIVNSGGLRNELLYAGDTSSNPANTDGVVTFAEANAVLPFVNNIWLVTLTGAELKQVLEQQWQPEGSSRPYLQLGLSDNVRVTVDPARAAGSRVTSVSINGKPLRAKADYTVSTFSFLGGGGDNFTAFKSGTSKDTGLVDRDLWISYLKDHQGLAPDFARQQVQATGLPTSVAGGDRVSVDVAQLDLTSQGAPRNTRVRAYLVRADQQVAVGSFPVTDGAASVDFTAPKRLGKGYHLRLVAQPSGTTIGRDRSGSSSGGVSFSVRPNVIKVDRSKVRIVVRFTADGQPVLGRLTWRGNGRSGVEKLHNGRAVVKVGRYATPGKKIVRFRIFDRETGTWSTASVSFAVQR